MKLSAEAGDWDWDIYNIDTGESIKMVCRLDEEAGECCVIETDERGRVKADAARNVAVKTLKGNFFAVPGGESPPHFVRVK